jgi:MATE family multidrug resistance protein
MFPMIMFSAWRSPSSWQAPWRTELRALWILALPLIGTQLSQIAILTTDVLMMGWLGSASLAAGALGSNVFFIPWIFGIGIMIATSPMMAQAIGRKRRMVRDVRRTVRQGLWMAVAVGVPGMIVVWHTESVLLALGQDPANAVLAQEFARPLAWGMIPALGFMALRQFVSALQRPNAALVVQIVTLAINATLDYGLMFGKLGFPALGLAGAGIASSTAHAASFVLLLAVIYADRRFRRFHILGRFWRPDWRRFAEIFRLGLPIALSTLFEVAAFSGAVYIMGTIGTPEIAAHQIAIQCAATTFMVPLAIGQAATVRVGIFAGAGDAAGIRRAGWLAFAISFGFMLLMAVLLLWVRAPLVDLFLDRTQPENARTADIAEAFLMIAAFFQVFDGTQATGMGILRGLKDTRVPMVYAGIGYWLIGLASGVAAARWLDMGGIGVWCGLALGLAVVAVLVVIRFARRERLGLVPVPPS